MCLKEVFGDDHKKGGSCEADNRRDSQQAPQSRTDAILSEGSFRFLPLSILKWDGLEEMNGFAAIGGLQREINV